MSGLKVDFHVHTDHSKDSRASPITVVNRALELGFDAIAVTDHNTVRGSLEAEKLARGSSLLVIPGQEVHTQEGEVIILNIRETLPNKMPALDTMKAAKKLGGYVIVPHPFDLMRKGLGKQTQHCLKYIDAVEVFNARTIFGRFNTKAMAFADDHGLPKTVGSDSHFPEEMGKAFVLVDSSKDIQSILSALSACKTELIMTKQPMPHRIKRGLLKIRTYF